MKNLFTIILVFFGANEMNAFGQLTVSLSKNTDPCGTRTITTTVTGGSGNYQYIYALGDTETGPPITTNNVATYTVNPQPLRVTNYKVTVLDMTTFQFGQDTITLTASTDIEPPIVLSNVISPNGDWINDVWYVKNVADPTDLTLGIGATSYELIIFRADNSIYLNKSSSVPSGLLASHVFWNGRLNNVGGRGPIGTYYYSLTLWNCKYPSGKTYTGWIAMNY